MWTGAAHSLLHPRRLLALLGCFGRHWRGWIVVAATLVAFWFSFTSLRDLVLSNSPAGLVAFVPIGTLIVLWGRLRVLPDRRPEGRDLFFDGVTAAVPLATVLILIVVLPTRLSLVYWLYRIDLLAVPLFVTGVITVVWGFWALWRIWPALVYLLLISPLPFIWFQQWFGEAFVDASVWGGRGLLGLTGLPVQVDPADGRTFICQASGHEFEVFVGQVCSGTNLALGFLLVGAPVMSRFAGRLSRKLVWLATGAVLCVGLNMLRVFLLLVSHYALDEDVVAEIVHPALGAALFLALFVGMLFATRWFGLRFQGARVEGGDWIWMATPPQIGGRAASTLLALTVTVAVFDAGLADFAWAREDRLPAIEIASPEAFLPTVEGWTLEHDRRLLWGAYFGPGSRSDAYTYHSEAIPDLVAQTVIARTLGQLNAHLPEACDLFHGHEILGSRQVPLGRGVTGTIVHTFYQDGPLVTLHWTMPVVLEGELSYARIALFLDDELPVPPAPLETVDANVLSLATTALNSKLGEYAEPAGDRTLDRIEGHLKALARQIVAALVG